jgi:hypothetical protein
MFVIWDRLYAHSVDLDYDLIINEEVCEGDLANQKIVISEQIK